MKRDHLIILFVMVIFAILIAGKQSLFVIVPGIEKEGWERYEMKWGSQALKMSNGETKTLSEMGIPPEVIGDFSEELITGKFYVATEQFHNTDLTFNYTMYCKSRIPSSELEFFDVFIHEPGLTNNPIITIPFILEGEPNNDYKWHRMWKEEWNHTSENILTVLVVDRISEEGFKCYEVYKHHNTWGRFCSEFGYIVRIFVDSEYADCNVSLYDVKIDDHRFDPICGNRICEENETVENCFSDCYIPPNCGDNTCTEEESCNNCAADCGICPIVCGDGICLEGEICNKDCEEPNNLLIWVIVLIVVFVYLIKKKVIKI